MRRFIALTILCLTINPSAKPSQNSKTNQHQADQRTAPPVVISNDQKTTNETRQDQQPIPPWYRTVEWSNWLLVIAGVITAWAVFKQARDTAESARATRDSVKNSEKALILAERPRLKVRNIIINIPKVRTSSEARWKAYFDTVNKGGTPAEVVFSHCVAGAFAHLPAIRAFQVDEEPNDPIDPGTNIRPGEIIQGCFTVEAKELHTLLWMAENPQSFNPPPPYYVMGFVRYEDELRILRETVFCRRFDYFTKRFSTVQDEDYEYAD